LLESSKTNTRTVGAHCFLSEDQQNRSTHYLDVMARLKRGVTLSQAQAEMSAIAARLTSKVS